MNSYVSAIVAHLAFVLTTKSLNDLISTYIQQGLSQGLGSVILLTFLVQVLCFFGLQGHNLAPIMDGIYGVALNQNTAVYEATSDVSQLPWIWTRGLFDAYVQMGGSGVTIGLLIAIFIFSKRPVKSIKPLLSRLIQWEYLILRILLFLVCLSY